MEHNITRIVSSDISLSYLMLTHDGNQALQRNSQSLLLNHTNVRDYSVCYTKCTNEHATCITNMQESKGKELQEKVKETGWVIFKYSCLCISAMTCTTKTPLMKWFQIFLEWRRNILMKDFHLQFLIDFP